MPVIFALTALGILFLLRFFVALCRDPGYKRVKHSYYLAGRMKPEGEAGDDFCARKARGAAR